MGLFKNFTWEEVAPDAKCGHITLSGLVDGCADKKELYIKYPLSIVSGYPPNDYYVVLFASNEWPQSKILSLKHKDKSIGLLFPIEILVSGLQPTGDGYEEMYENYASLSLMKMCKGEVVGTPFYLDYAADQKEEYTITDFYHKDTVIAIFMRNKFFPDRLDMPSHSDMILNYFYTFLPEFYGYGLFPYPYGPESDCLDMPKNYRPFKLLWNEDDRYLNLRRCSRMLNRDTKNYILEVATKIDPYETNPFFRFFLYYQVLELFMQDIYRSHTRILQKKINSGSQDMVLLRDAIDEFKGKTNEKSRLVEIFSKNNFEFGKELIRLCGDIAKMCSGQEKSYENIGHAIYETRNNLFHGFSRVAKAKDEFSQLSDLMLLLVCRLAVNYKK
jgi:hypothetical protein